ncbi:hypothetical protein Taro_051217 [Colocasia esculenta]|uniref:E3 ubiquitin-protein ligase RMA n=1 Tax=Colocasia esculenta TaxID=4460 RepID=A0A843XFD7_COLES|nr:hypothetical protein [Colocasia esculenta]
MLGIQIQTQGKTLRKKSCEEKEKDKDRFARVLSLVPARPSWPPSKADCSSSSSYYPSTFLPAHTPRPQRDLWKPSSSRPLSSAGVQEQEEARSRRIFLTAKHISESMDPGVGHRLGKQERSTNQESRSKLEEADSAPPAAHACFDCNICLDYAVEPVVTLCGHLYCWPCIYKWLQQESTTPQQCPVCKAALSPTTLVPLYGRGYSDGCKVDDHVAGHDIPRRPSTSFAARHAETTAPPAHRRQILEPQRHRRPQGNYMVSSSSTTRLLPPTMLGGTAIAVLPWVLGDEWLGSSYLGSHHPIGASNNPRLRRQEMQDRISLHRISIFFFCCLVLCLLVF